MESIGSRRFSPRRKKKRSAATWLTTVPTASLPSCKWSWQALRHAGDILAAKELRQFRQLCSPGKLVEDAAHMNEQIDIGCRCQGSRLRVQVSKPAKNVWIALQPVERTNFGVLGPKPRQEVASGAAIVTNGIRMKSSAE